MNPNDVDLTINYFVIVPTGNQWDGDIVEPFQTIEAAKKEYQRYKDLHNECYLVKTVEANNPEK